MIISLTKERTCNYVLTEVPSEMQRKLDLELEKVCMTLGKSLGPLKSQIPYLEDERQI